MHTYSKGYICMYERQLNNSHCQRRSEVGPLGHWPQEPNIFLGIIYNWFLKFLRNFFQLTGNQLKKIKI